MGSETIVGEVRCTLDEALRRKLREADETAARVLGDRMGYYVGLVEGLRQWAFRAGDDGRRTELLLRAFDLVEDIEAAGRRGE